MLSVQLFAVKCALVLVSVTLVREWIAKSWSKSVLWVLKEELAVVEEVEGVGDEAVCGVVCLCDSDDDEFADVV